jgi:hypothetical protein
MRAATIAFGLCVLATPAFAQGLSRAPEYQALDAGRPQKALQLLRVRFADNPQHPALINSAMIYAVLGDVGIERDTLVLRAVKHTRGAVENVPDEDLEGFGQATSFAFYAMYHASFGTMTTARGTLARLAILAKNDPSDGVQRIKRAADLFVATRARTARAIDIDRVAKDLADVEGPFWTAVGALILAQAQAKANPAKAATTALSVNEEIMRAPRLLVAARAAMAAGDRKAAAAHYAELLKMREAAEPSLAAWRAGIAAEARKAQN